MPASGMQIAGHRGASGYAPENTLLAFHKAIDIGCDWLELDVRLSKDGHAVVIHDQTVDRTTNGKGLISEMTLEEIKKLDCSDGQKIPTLIEIIEFCGNSIKLLIELKAPGTPAIVNTILAKHKIITNSVIISFDLDLFTGLTHLDNLA